jgi:hypothetical protein
MAPFFSFLQINVYSVLASKYKQIYPLRASYGGNLYVPPRRSFTGHRGT